MTALIERYECGRCGREVRAGKKKHFCGAPYPLKATDDLRVSRYVRLDDMEQIFAGHVCKHQPPCDCTKGQLLRLLRSAEGEDRSNQPASPSLDDAEAMFAPAFALHGKTIKGSMSMGDVYALDFTDGTHLWLTVKHHGPQDGGRTSISVEMREGPL